jgi:hypothetical protein
VVRKPSNTAIKHYAKPPEVVAEELGTRVLQVRW